MTALEAFRYAENKVKEFYESEKRLATEHARLAGDLAGSFVLTRLGSTLEASTDPKARKLLAERDRLEREIGQLRQKKGEMESEEYERELQRLLVELARTQAQIDRAVEKQ